jgi:hypothetical protein
LTTLSILRGNVDKPVPVTERERVSKDILTFLKA